MHDYHAMTSLIDRVLATPGDPPTEVRIQAGPTFTPEALTQAYEILTMGTRLGALCVCPFCGAPGPVPRTPHLELIATS